MQSPDLKIILSAGAVLAGSSPQTPSSNLKEVLTSRLVRYSEILEHQTPTPFENDALENLQSETASAALHVISSIQRLLHDDDSEMIGTRDMAQIRTLSSIAFKWEVEPLLSRVVSAIPTTTSSARQSTTRQIIDLTSVPEDYSRLCSTIKTLLEIILPSRGTGPSFNTPIIAYLVDKHLSDILRPCIILGWLPVNLSSDSVKPLDALRPPVIQILTHLAVSQSISALSSVLSGAALPAYARKACGFLMSRQILRRDGVTGLFIALFSEEDISDDAAPLEKLEHVAKLLHTIPGGLDEKQYFNNIVPQLLSVLSSDSQAIPSSHSRAAAFTLSRMMIPDTNNPRIAVATSILLKLLHRPLLRVSSPLGIEAESSPEESPTNLTPRVALHTLTTLLTNTDPAPEVISSLLTPIVPSLFALWSTLNEHKTADPTLRASVKGLLETWGRLISEAVGIAALWLVVEGEGGDWTVDVAGEIARTDVENPQLDSLSLFTPEDLRRAEESGELDSGSNIFHLRPDPIQFVDYLKSIDRVDISSDIFVRLLGAYQESKGNSESDPMRTLLYLQIVMQIQTQLSANDSSTNILKKPEHILSFIKTAMESSFTAPPKEAKPKLKEHRGLTLESLRIVEVPDEEEEDGDSDDEEPPEGTPKSSDDEMTTTAMNLLLSILEANPSMTTSNTALLDEIFDLLVRLAKEGSESLRPLAREARMVLTARLASTSASASAPKTKRTSGEENAQETYQKALKLLQDQLLPVRAHGLLLLRQLVASRPGKEGRLEAPSLDRALIPGILSIFLQSLQDDDSYIYLNAVQGLAAMVDGFGKDVLKGLVDLYSEGSEGVGSTALTKEDIDTRTKIGEALGQIIRRCGQALPKYADILVPPLFKILRTSHLPTSLRTSSLSLLAQCANTSSLALLPYTVDLTNAIIDLLQVETVSATPQVTKTQADAEQDNPAPTMDSQPTSINSKFPPLRRAALHFLSLLTRACSNQIAEGSTTMLYTFPRQLLQRANRTVGYIAVTDEDAVVRVMAKEALEGLNNLEELILGR